jgi:hypothetical protein
LGEKEPAEIVLNPDGHLQIRVGRQYKFADFAECKIFTAKQEPGLSAAPTQIITSDQRSLVESLLQLRRQVWFGLRIDHFVVYGNGRDQNKSSPPAAPALLAIIVWRAPRVKSHCSEQSANGESLRPTARHPIGHSGLAATHPIWNIYGRRTFEFRRGDTTPLAPPPTEAA